jgi:serine O-acetyltransferase
VLNFEEGPGRKAECKQEIAAERDSATEIPDIVEHLVECHKKGAVYSHIGPEPLPSRDTVIQIVERSIRLLYPGYFSSVRIDSVSVPYYLGQQVTELYNLLSEQCTYAIRHDCRRFDLPCTHCEDRGRRVAVDFLKKMPLLQEALSKDVSAAYEGDPAARYHDEIIYSYPGLFAITIYRIAHVLHVLGLPVIPRIMTEYAHSRTGIDIHPGVSIGESFFIDHGTGVVIGETATIGNRVRIYQGVTLGALSLNKDECEQLRNRKRHPTIEDDVIIYANATILGGSTVIGERSVIGGNVWLTESVPPDTTVFLKKPELIYREKK